MWWFATAWAGPLDLPVPSPCAQRWDTNGDGRWDSVERFEYDADRFLSRITIDDDADGKPETILTLTHDAVGRPLTARHDDDADGKIDRVSDCSTSYCSTNWIPVCPANAECTRNELGLIDVMTFRATPVVNDYSCWVHTDRGWAYQAPR